MLTKNGLRLFEIFGEYIDKNIKVWTYIDIHGVWVGIVYGKMWKSYRIKYGDEYWVAHEWAIDKIIGIPPTLSTVLRYCEINKLYPWEISKWIMRIDWVWKTFHFDLAKELKDRSEEKKGELILFLESIK